MDGNPFSWNKVRWMRFEKQFGIIKFKTSRKKDLRDLLPLQDSNFHEFYKSLPTNRKPNYDPDIQESMNNFYNHQFSKQTTTFEI